MTRMLRFCCLHLNLTITVSFSFKRWHAWRSSGFTSYPVRENALQTLLPIDAETGFISSDSRRWYWALLTGLISNWTILSVSKRLQFLLTVSSELRISYRLRKSSKRLVTSDSLGDISSTLISSSINSFLKDFPVGFLFQPLKCMNIDDTR